MKTAQLKNPLPAGQPDNGNGAMDQEKKEYIPEYFSKNPLLKSLFTDVKRGKITYRYLYRETGYSKATLSLVFRGKYTGDLQKVVQKLIKAAEDYYSRGDLVKIRALVNIRKLCQEAWENFEINSVYGPAGSGKTEGLKSYFQENHENTIFITIWESDTAKEVVDKIADELDISFNYESISKRIHRICTQLRVAPKLIIVDEADNGNVKILNCLRQIWDEAECGMVFSGNLKLKQMMTRGEGLMQNLSYLYRRITKVLRIDSLELGDAQKLLERYPNVDISEACIKEVTKMCKNHGETDRFCKIMDAAIEQAEYNLREKVDDEVVLFAAKSMLWG